MTAAREIEDLEKARWYLDREIARLRGLKAEPAGNALKCCKCGLTHTDEPTVQRRVHGMVFCNDCHTTWLNRGPQR